MDRKVAVLLLLPSLLYVSHDARLGGSGSSSPPDAASVPSAGCAEEPPGSRAITAISFDPGVAAEAVRPARRVVADGGHEGGDDRRGRPHVRFPSGSGWEASAGERDVGIVTDPSAPGSPPFVAEARYPVGFGDGRSPLYLERDIASEELSRLYVCLWVKLSENWQGHDTGVNKIGYVWADGKPVVSLVSVGAGDAALVPQIRLQDLPSRLASARNLEPDGGVTVRRGAWHRWEVLLVMNDGAEADGEVHWWIDGRKVGEYRDVPFVVPPGEGIWERVSWRPIWGGRGDAVREPMYMWLDHLSVSGSR